MRRIDVATAVVGFVLLVPALVATARAAGEWGDALAYARAERCTPAAAVSTPRDCVTERPARVITTLESGDGYQVYYDVAGIPLSEDAARGLVTLLRPDPLSDRLGATAAVEVEMWDGLVTRVSSGGDASVTDDAPPARAARSSAAVAPWTFAGLALVAVAFARHRAAALFGMAVAGGAVLQVAADREPFTEGVTPLAIFLVVTIGGSWLLQVSRTEPAASRPTPPAARPAAR